MASFEYFLGENPSGRELSEHVFDPLLRADGKETAAKLLDLCQKSSATRRQILDTLKDPSLEEVGVAQEYEIFLKRLYNDTIVPSPELKVHGETMDLSINDQQSFDKAVSILQNHLRSLPLLETHLEVSQLLYSKGCISEATLDEMERMDQSRSLDDKKTTLLTAIQETVSSDYRKLQVIATALSVIEETKGLANEVLTDYVMKTDEASVQVICTCASDILRNNYYVLSQSVSNRKAVALITSKCYCNSIFSDDLYKLIVSASIKFEEPLSISRTLLLKGIRDSVCADFKNLETFATILQSFAETKDVGDTICEEYTVNFDNEMDYNFSSKQGKESHQQIKRVSFHDFKIQSNSSGSYKIVLSHHIKKQFEQIQLKFRLLFNKFRQGISSSKPNEISHITYYIKDYCNKYQPNTIDDIINSLRSICKITNLGFLESISQEFNVTDALQAIKLFAEDMKIFLKHISLELGLKLQAVSPSLHESQTQIIFVLTWKPDVGELKYMKDILDDILHVEFPAPSMKFSIEIDQSCVNTDESRTLNDDKAIYLEVERSGVIHHCNQSGVTIVIPEGAVQQQATLSFEACLFHDKLNLSDYIPVTPIVRLQLYPYQELMKPIELYLPHHITDVDFTVKNQLVCLKGDNADESIPLQKVTEVFPQLCKLTCHHFHTYCVAASICQYERLNRRYIIAMAEKQEDDMTLHVHFCLFSCQQACKKFVESQYAKKRFTVSTFKVMKLNGSDHISVSFNPNDVAGWEMEFHGFKKDNKILEKKADYFEALACKDRIVSKEDINKFNFMVDELLYPPRLCFQFRCINMSLIDQPKTTVTAVISGILDTPMEIPITLKKPRCFLRQPSQVMDSTIDKILEESLIIVTKAFEEECTNENSWYNFGLFLKLRYHELNRIEIKHTKAVQCARNVIAEWRVQNKKASWEPVAKALQSINLETLANQFESHMKQKDAMETEEVLSKRKKKTKPKKVRQKNPAGIKDLSKVLSILKDASFFATDWYTLGLKLGLYATSLHVIKSQDANDHLRLTNTMQAWLQKKDGVKKTTWKKLIHAVRKTNNKAAADEITRQIKFVD